jgi:hypothetical protein
MASASARASSASIAIRVGQNSPSRSMVNRDPFHAFATVRRSQPTIERHSGAHGYPPSGVFSRTVMPPLG